MVLAAITDRQSLESDVTAFVERAMASGVDWVQIREKDLSARRLWELCRAVREKKNPHGTKLLVNDRLDVALAAGLDGVHLPADSISPAKARQLAGPQFLIGVSCHSMEELKRAESEGASYAFYSPVFASSSKPGYGPAKGVEALKAACEAVSIPVLALGGVTAANAGKCMATGAAGVAGIALFQAAEDLGATVEELRKRR